MNAGRFPFPLPTPFIAIRPIIIPLISPQFDTLYIIRSSEPIM